MDGVVELVKIFEKCVLGGDAKQIQMQRSMLAILVHRILGGGTPNRSNTGFCRTALPERSGTNCLPFAPNPISGCRCRSIIGC
jgi:hypothetical protein